MPRFMLTKDCIVFDHRDRRIFIFSSPFLTYDTDPVTEYNRCVAHITELVGRIASIPKSPAAPDAPALTGTKISKKSPAITDNTGREAFTHAVNGIKEHIVAGDIFQAVLSRRMECAVDIRPVPHLRGAADNQPEPVHVLP